MISIFQSIDTSKFTDIDFEILSFIQQHAKLVSTMKIEELSSTLFTSNATVIRFCKKLNYSGYNALKYALKEELYQQVNGNLKKELETDLVQYKDFLANIPMDTVLDVVSLICNDFPLYIHGRSLSAIPAKYLYTVLNSVDRRCIFLEDLHLIRNISSTIEKDSTIILVTANADDKVFAPIISLAKKRQAKTVVLTSNENSKIVTMADFTLLSFDQNTYHQNIDVSTRIGIITIIQMLIEISCDRLLS